MVIDYDKIIAEIQANGIVVTDKEEFDFYVKNYNINTFFNAYCDFFEEEDGTYKNVNSSDIIKLYEFDKNLGNHLFRYMLVIEKIINTNIAISTINHFNIENKCLFSLPIEKIKNEVLPNVNKIEPYISFESFLFKITKFLESNKQIKKLQVEGEEDVALRWAKVPLDLMCLTWSFSTTFSFYLASIGEVRQIILENFGIDRQYSKGFTDLIKNLINVRNHISHNISIYNTPIKYCTDELCQLYSFFFKKNVDKQNFKLIHLINFVAHLSNNKELLEKTQYFAFNLKINEKAHAKIKKIFEL